MGPNFGLPVNSMKYSKFNTLIRRPFTEKFQLSANYAKSCHGVNISSPDRLRLSSLTVVTADTWSIESSARGKGF